MTEMKHMETPWRADINDDGSFSIEPVDWPLRVICQRTQWSGRAAQSRANAAFIVRAVNAHDELVAALQAIVDHHEGAGETDSPLMQQARAALSRAQPADLAKAQG